MRIGMSLLEVVLAIAISMSLITILFQTMSQTNTVFQKIVTISGLERKVTIFQAIFEKEVSGIVIPELIWDEQKLHSADDESEEKIDEKSSDTQQEKKVDASAQENKKIPQVFVYEKDEQNNVKFFTFITTNPVTVYGDKGSHLMRCMYRLMPDTQRPGTYQLLHQQSDNLDPKSCALDSEKAVRPYPLLTGITHITCEFYIEKKEKEPKKEEPHKGDEQKKDVKKDKEKNDDTSKEEKIKEFIIESEWKEKEERKESEQEKKDSKKSKEDADKEKQKNDQEQERPDLPDYIHMKVTVLDDQNKPHTYDYWCAPLYNKGCVDEEIRTKKKREKKRSQQVMHEQQSMLHDAKGAQK